jgi:acetylglutamate kinase
MSHNISNETRAELLTQAMPYIQKYRNKIIVIKYGGNAMISDELKQQVMEDISLLHAIGVHVVLVHGGGPEINSMLNRLGKKSEFVDGLRVTDAETIEVVQMVLAGKVNKNLVHLLEQKGAKAIGLCGIDGHMIQATMKDPDLGYVGRITGVNVQVVRDVMAQGYIPVISTIGCDADGNVYNINAEELFNQGIISGGMIPKVECCIDAIHRGVGRVIVMDGRVNHSILLEILTNEGAGTMVMESKEQ